ncbi:DEAD/DEAH box helicase [Bradyrhizobium valentinum]|uniref:DEAD/DEAH box helicase n=1 Tax=Bradyrhizobium valentinum TaxID=1518501 RepID=UPI00070B8044|nr:DEAD/DEAH box helicase [Bradyrhizobium valentinum]KRQ93041.1 DEAD/DEAH box helicase [Bradyrhizobium valentinum]
MAFRGLFIGIDRYISPGIDELTCARRDAMALEALFFDTLGGSTVLLTNADATRQQIEVSFADLAKCDPEDTVVIAFSGHGSETHELVTHDADLADLTRSAIPLDLLQEWFSRIPAKRLILFLDCCFSGGIGAKVLHIDTKARSIFSTEARLAQLAGAGRIIFTASAATEPAYEHRRFGHGFLTHFLLEALRGAEEVVSGGKISLYRVLEHVTGRVKSAASQGGKLQNPTMRGSIDGDVEWPVFVAGAKYHAVFPARLPAKVTSDLSSLATAGFPNTLISAWAGAIPSLNALQIAAINDFGVLDSENLVVSAPTSSGKTMVGELAALRSVLDRKRALFLLPLKALVADKRRYFANVYGAFGVRTVEATGETDDITPLLRGQYDIGLLTYEKFAAIALTFPHVLAQVGVIVIDEAQMIADRGRGANLEFILTLIRMRRREGIEPQLIALSAVIGDTNSLEQWLGARLLRRTERPVPLDEGLLLGNGYFRFIDPTTGKEKVEGPLIQPNFGKGSSQDLIIPLVRKLVAEGQQVIVFRETKGEARGCANYLAGALGLPPATEALAQMPAGDPSQASVDLREALSRGVAFHNADLEREERRIVEEEFRRPSSGLRVIAATTTLAMGVNTPASSVIIAGLDHPGDQPYSVAEYKNLVGRAGRLGFAEKGASYLLALDPCAEHDLWSRYVTAAPEDLVSRFLDDTTDPRSLIIRVLVAARRAAGEGVASEEIIEFLESSFGAFQAQRARTGWQWNRPDLLAALADLERHRLVEKNVAGAYELTKLGRLAGESAAEVGSIVALVDCLARLQPQEISDPVLIAAAQTTVELDQVLFPINKKSTQKEPQLWPNELRGQGVAWQVLNALQRGVMEDHQATLRAKKSVACLLFVSGRAMNEIERLLTQFGGAFGGAAGPIRSVAARTCDLMPVAARVAEILHPTLDLGNRVGRLAIRLTYGIPSAAVDLAQLAGADLLRGDYCRLASAHLCEPDQISAASDEQLLTCLDKDKRKLQLVRDVAQRIAKRRAQAATAQIPVLDAYVA